MYNKALIASAAQESLIAEKVFQKALKESPRSGRLADAFARHLYANKQTEYAIKTIENYLSLIGNNLSSIALLEKIKKKESLKLLVNNANEG